jgi:3',5'-cyclic AMP phosphodiesterase CpdA
VHYVVVLNVFNFEKLGLLGSEQLDWLAKDLAAVAASTPVVVFTHVPLYALYPQWGWTTEDGTKALALLQKFDRVTVLNGHIHQVVTHQEGNIRFASADATAYPQPKPGAAAKPGPVTLAHDDLLRAIGYRTVEIEAGNLRLEDRALG